MKLVFLDIESKDLNATNGIGFMLCVCAKEAGVSQKVQTFRIDQSPGYGTKKPLYDDSWLCRRLRTYLTEVDPDFIVGHNLKYFDIPYINSRLLANGLKPLEPRIVIDTWKLCRYDLKLHSASLDALSEHLGVEHRKTRYEPKVWQRASYGTKADMDKIVHHCELDVLVLEECFERISPLMRKLKGYW